MTETPNYPANDPQQIIAELQRKLNERTAERDEATSQQAATADILKVISRSAFDLQLVLDALVESVAKLCDTDRAVLIQKQGDQYYRVALQGFPANAIAEMKGVPVDLKAGSIAARALRNCTVVHVADVNADPEYPGTPAQSLGGVRTVLSVPLVRETQPVGAITVSRIRVEPFTEKQIDLIRTFADQAVIAIENARLFNETKEALERQTATAEILKVIAASPSDVQPVFEAIAERSNRLVSGFSTAVHRLIDGQQHLKAFTRISPEADAVIQSAFPRPLTDLTGAEQIRNGEIFEITDTELEFTQQPSLLEMARKRGYRSMVIVPLLRDREPIGLINVTRRGTGRFAAHHVNLLRTFADQAVIAIENARLFEEVQARTRELMESLQIQTATSEVLKVISRSPDALQPVLDAIAKTACELCGSDGVTIFLLRDEKFHFTAVSGVVPKHLEYLRANPTATDEPTSVFGQVMLKKRTIHYANVFDHPELDQHRIRLGGERALLMVPLLRDDQILGVIVLRQSHMRPFTPPQIQAIEVFADQAVIAISNVGLFEQVQRRTFELSQSLDELRAAQNRLIQTEKLASLGQLTAGIAHEIKNPLNFVNNFSALTADLTDELKGVLRSAALSDEIREEIDDLTRTMKDNLEKIVQHGKRADSIVKNMLLHSREGSGEHRPVEINAILDESLNLAYHGARAEKPGFSITLQRDFDPATGMADVYPQEITRVLLNLISNGFYAATRRAAETGEGFEPALRAATKNLGDKIEIRIRDNGIGIAPEVKEKIFNPFFTTKPAGEGTGLGLSMSHDIVVKQHGGTIDVDTEPGIFTEFIVTLPRTIVSLKTGGGTN
jgi:two-component system NtrC family sensor kinase